MVKAKTASPKTPTTSATAPTQGAADAGDAQAYVPEALVGAEIADGRYRLKSMCGEGSMAHVFKAFDTRLETDVIIKIPKPEKIADAGFRERFKQERKLLVRLSHPHVVRILDMGAHRGLPYVVMQYLPGGDLKERLGELMAKGGQLSAGSLKRWIREMGSALDFVAQQGMVHRDVKPANVLFDEHNNAFLSDFGLTKILIGDHRDTDSEMTGAGFIVGTPNYVAPEIVLGEPYDGRSDQYSLGILVYHLLCGEPPMQGLSSSATMVNQTQKVLPPISEVRRDVPVAVAVAIQKAIAKKADDRFPTSLAFAEAVVAGLNGQGTPSSSSSRLTPARVPAARNAEATNRPRSRTAHQSRLQSGSRSSSSTISQGDSIRERVSKGEKGLVKCPECRVPLPLRPLHAGRTGACIHCRARLKISKDLTKLYFLAHAGAVPSKKGKKNGSSTDGSGELMIGEEIFGMTVPKKIALALAALLLVVTLGATVYITVFMTGETEEDKLEQRIDSGRSLESSLDVSPDE